MMKEDRTNAPFSRSMAKLITSLSILLLVGCVENKTEETQAAKSITVNKGAVSSDVVARVDGVEISAEQVKNLIESVDGGLTKDQAVEVLIENELLAAEATRRGLSNKPEVADAKKVELARALLRTRIKKGVTTDTVDEEKLKELYEVNKEHFVHGVLRRVRHILIHTGKTGVPDEEAAKFAAEIAEKAAEIATEEEFAELYDSVKDRYPGKTRIESLQPFSAETKMFVSDFVKAAFAIPSVGQTSPPAKTEFGWHVIFVVEELPPENRSFEDVRTELAENVLPFEKKYQFHQLLENLKRRDGVFVYQDAIDSGKPAQ